jgi:hypothetical protein
MAFEIPSREEIHGEFIADYAGAQTDVNVSRGSDPYRLGRVISGIAWSILAKLLFYLKMALPDTAVGEFLLRWGIIYDFLPKGPAGSARELSLEVSGTPG